MKSLFLLLTAFLLQIDGLKKGERWEEIVRLGEEAIVQCEDLREEFAIADQLVSSYFRLGRFEEAREKAESLVVLAEKIGSYELLVDSFYKLSAALRGQELFAEARAFATRALEVWDLHCSTDLRLKGRVLFNAGAAECDDPGGDHSKGISMYEEALSLFTEDDYRQRTLIRLAKARLLQGELPLSRGIVDQLKQEALEERTKMHLCYLEAQLLQAESVQKAKEGRDLAIRLNASADRKRFEAFLNQQVR